MESLLPSRIALAHLLVINMDGTKQYLGSVARCTMQWRPIDLFGARPGYRLRHLHLHRSQHAHHGLHLRHLSHLHRLRFPRHLLGTNNANFAPQRHPFTPRSPRPMSSPGASSTVNEGYTCRPIEIPPVEQWKPDVDFHDSNKINGLDFPSRIRQSRFSSYKDIEGMDPLQVPLWKFLYQGLHNTWLRRVAYGRETFVLPFDNIGTTVFVAELV